MSRRRRSKAVIEGERSSLGDSQLNEGIGVLNAMCNKTIAQMVDYKYSVEGVLPALFDDETLAKLRQVRGMVDPANAVEHYSIHPHISLHVNFTGLTVPTITAKMFHINPERSLPLREAIGEIMEIHEKFEVCKHVLRWLNKNATPGAIRYYFPGAMKLCPASPALMELQHTPVRFSTPPGISSQLSLIREAANIVASATLLPQDAPVKPRGGLWLVFSPYELRRLSFTNGDPAISDPAISAGPAFDTDVMTYNL